MKMFKNGKKRKRKNIAQIWVLRKLIWPSHLRADLSAYRTPRRLAIRYILAKLWTENLK
jgi:hypothetical protein